MSDSDKMRRWCFTYHMDFAVDNPYWDDICGDKVSEWDFKCAHFKCGVFQLEIAPDTRKVHFQGYLEFDAPVRRNFVKNKFFQSDKPHLEAARGDWKQNETYCTKEATRFPTTEPIFIPDLETWNQFHSQQGKRNDLADAVETLRTKKRVADVALEHPTTFVKYHKGFHALANALNVPRSSGYTPHVRFYWGPTGSGKTSDVYSEFTPEQIYIKECSTKWWDGYEGQAVVLFDDFDGFSKKTTDELPITMMLRVLDRYPCQVETKGGHVSLADATKTFIITTNRDFDMLYPNATDGHRAALKRRIHEFVEFPNDASRERLAEYPDSE